MASVPGGSIHKEEKCCLYTKGQRMEFYKKMYISPKIRDPRRTRQDLQRGKGHLTVYLLVLTEGPEGRPQLEIMHCANFLQPYYKDHSVYVVGMASGKADAIQMVNMITQEAFDRTGQWEAALYLAERTGWAPVSEELPVY